MDAVKKKDKKAVAAMAKELAVKGAELINVQVSSDGSGDEDSLPFAAEAVQDGAGLPLCLDSRNVKALKKANRNLYYAVKYVTLGGLLTAFVVWV